MNYQFFNNHHQNHTSYPNNIDNYNTAGDALPNVQRIRGEVYYRERHSTSCRSIGTSHVNGAHQRVPCSLPSCLDVDGEDVA